MIAIAKCSIIARKNVLTEVERGYSASQKAFILCTCRSVWCQRLLNFAFFVSSQDILILQQWNSPIVHMGYNYIAYTLGSTDLHLHKVIYKCTSSIADSDVMSVLDIMYLSHGPILGQPQF